MRRCRMAETKPDPMVERAWMALKKLGELDLDPYGPGYFVHRERPADMDVRIDAVVHLDRFVELLLGNRTDRLIKTMDALREPRWELRHVGFDAWSVVPRTPLGERLQFNDPALDATARYYGPYRLKSDAEARLHRCLAEQILKALEGNAS